MTNEANLRMDDPVLGLLEQALSTKQIWVGRNALRPALARLGGTYDERQQHLQSLLDSGFVQIDQLGEFSLTLQGALFHSKAQIYRTFIREIWPILNGENRVNPAFTSITWNKIADHSDYVGATLKETDRVWFWNVLVLCGLTARQTFPGNDAEWHLASDVVEMLLSDAASSDEMLELLLKLHEPQQPEPPEQPAENPATTSRAVEGSGALAFSDLHPTVVEAAKSLFESRHYTEAVAAAFMLIPKEVVTRTGAERDDGTGMIMRTFSPERKKSKRLLLGGPKTPVTEDRQRGLMHMAAGSQLAIRNPAGHFGLDISSATDAMEHLAIASWLMKMIDATELDDPDDPEGATLPPA